MIQIREIDHLVLRVVDLERMLRFYCEILGCSVERCQDEMVLVQLRAGRSLIDLVPVDGKLGMLVGAAAGSEARKNAAASGVGLVDAMPGDRLARVRRRGRYSVTESEFV